MGASFSKRISDTVEKLVPSPAKWSPAPARHVVSYDTNRMFIYGYITHLEGTVWTQPQVLLTLLFYLILATLYGLGICDATQKAKNGDACGTTEASVATCSSVYGHICFYAPSLSDGLVLASIVSFLMGVFITQTLQRWWVVRERLQVSMTNYGLVGSAWIDGLTDNAEGVALKKDMARYGCLALAVALKQCAEDKNLKDLVDKKLMTQQELDLLNAESFPNKYVLVSHWLSQLLARAALAGRVAFPCNFVPILQSYVANLRGAAADIFMYAGTPIPYTYSHLLSVIVKFHMFMTVVVAGSTLGKGIATGSNGLIVWGYVLMLINCMVFEGLLFIHSTLAKPFFKNPNHFYLPAILSSCQSTVNHAFALAPAGLPEAVRRHDPAARPGTVACCDAHSRNFSLQVVKPPPLPQPAAPSLAAVKEE